MSLVVALLAAWATMRLAPETPIAGLVRRLLVDGPARVLNRITRGHILLWIVLAGCAALLIWQLEGDGIRLLSLMAPEIVSWVTMLEVGTLGDVVVAVFATATAARVRGFGGDLATRLVLARPRIGRARRTRPIPRSADNDDEDRWLANAA